jgi:hypothetical protein
VYLLFEPWRAVGGRRSPFVIPGRRGASSPESILPIVAMDSGLALPPSLFELRRTRRAPRNDDVARARYLSSVRHRAMPNAALRKRAMITFLIDSDANRYKT